MKDFLILRLLPSVLLFVASVSAYDCKIESYQCFKKDNVWMRRDPKGTSGSECGCPCTGAKWMGIDGRSHKSENGNIYYKFPCNGGTFTIEYVGIKDNECATSYKIYVNGSQVGSGTVAKGSGEDVDKYYNVKINKSDVIKVWAASCPKTFDHGSYNRWDEMRFTRTGGSSDGGDTGGDTGGGTSSPPAQVSGLKTTSVTATEIALTWTASSGATSYDVYWTNVTTPDAGTDKTAYSITGLTPATTYSIWVKAINSAGAARGTNIEVTTKAPTVSAAKGCGVSANTPLMLRVEGGEFLIHGVEVGDIVTLFNLQGKVIDSRTIAPRNGMIPLPGKSTTLIRLSRDGVVLESWNVNAPR